MDLEEDSSAGYVGLETLRGRDFPGIRQFSIFSPNRVGQLQSLIRIVEEAHIQVCALAIAESAECAVIRLVLSTPDHAAELLRLNGFAFCEVEMLVVELPSSDYPIAAICSTLLKAEINVHYCYPMMLRPLGRPALAFYIDDHQAGVRVLEREGLRLLTEADLEG
ncbi:MAG: acetolactate synthase [Planctomycetia bacterium]